MTRWRALAAPMELGIMLMAAARARRRSLCGKSRSFWSLVYEWMVVMVPLLMPKASWRTLATGARQLVVQEALEMTWCEAGLKVLSFTPRTKVASGPSAGAEMIT